MKSFILVAVAALSAAVIAAPEQCINQAKANDVVSKFTTILLHKNETQSTQIANTLLTKDFKDYSDSILSLQGKPLGGPVFANRTDLLNNVYAAPAPKGIKTLYAGPTNCTSVVWQWIFTGLGSGQYDVKGFSIFKLNAQGKVYEIDVEFNSLAYARDIGFKVTPPPQPTTTTSTRLTTTATKA